jgi:hypothetical protein
MKRFVLAAGALPTLLFPLAANAQVATDAASDIECLAASLIISQNSEEMTEAQAMASVMYFIGKVTAREIDYTQPLATALGDMTNVSLQQTAARCGAELEYVGDDMERRSAEIDAVGETEAQP